MTFLIEGDRLTVRRGEGAPPARELWLPDCTIKPGPSTSPKGLALTPVVGPRSDRRAFGACYMLDGDELWLCDHGGNADRPKDFSMGVGIAYPKRIFVLKREAGKKARK